ncbi:MAG: glycosyltransferase family 61 protein [Xanthobacteraceae bacterium]|nr:glycosyltransferase family 61 protein [Xanthobacteraceae bacterium]
MDIEIDRARADMAIQRYAHLAQRSNSKMPHPSTFHFSRLRVAYAPSRSVSLVGNAVVLSGEWFVLAGEHALCDGYAQTPFPPWSAYHLGIVPPNGIELIHPSPVSLPVSKAFLLGGCPNYCHWLMDYLPRVALWEGDVPLLVNGSLKRFQIETLEALGIKADRLIELDYPNAYSIATLLYPSLNSSWCTGYLQFQPDIIDWLRGRFAPLFAVEQRQRRLFITRAGAADAAGRRLVNSEEIVRVAEQHGFEIVACETMSFAEQVRLFSQASVIAGPHGAGCTNLVFAPNGARVIELIGPRYGRDSSRGPLAFRHLAMLTNMEFTRLVGQSDEATPVANNHLPNEMFTIQPREFSAVLERL